MKNLFEIFYAPRPLSYGHVIAEIINREPISIDSLEKQGSLKLFIYEDNAESIESLVSIKDGLSLIYLLDTTALSAADPSISVVNLLNDECRILLPWSNRIGEFQKLYPNKKFFYLPIPIEIEGSNDGDSSGRLIAFIGPLESRLAETVRDLGGDRSKLRILNLNENPDLLKKVIFEDNLGDIEVFSPKSTDEVKDYIRNCEQVMFPHNTSLRDLHWSYLYALSIGKSVILGLRSEIESIPQIVPRYLLGGEVVSVDLESYSNDARNYIKEVHSLDAFNWELRKIANFIND